MENVEVSTSKEILDIPTPEEATNEARALVMKLIFFPGAFTLLELARLQDIMIAEGYMK